MLRVAILLLAVAAVPASSAAGLTDDDPSNDDDSYSWKLHLLDPSTGALCLDGSPGGFWLQKGTGSSPSSWVIHLQGGGWCGNELECVGRSHGRLGSSRNWTDVVDGPEARGANHGFLSRNASINGPFASWNKAFVGYCDGSSFAGNVLHPVAVGNSTLHFKGHAILRETLKALKEQHGMADATEVVISGTSAGGLAVYLHADHVAAEFNSSQTRVLALPDAGFFLDTPSFSGQYTYTPIYKYIFSMQNVSSGVNQDCLTYYTALGQEWKCFMAQYTLPFIKTPLFVSNSLEDRWQRENIMALNCDPMAAGNCTAAQMVYYISYRLTMINTLKQYGLLTSGKNGAFLQTCDVHVVTTVDQSWHGTLVQGQTQLDTFYAWYTGNSNSNTLAIDCEWPCNHSCYCNEQPYNNCVPTRRL